MPNHLAPALIGRCFNGRLLGNWKLQGHNMFCERIYHYNNNNHHIYSHKQLHVHGTYKALSTTNYNYIKTKQI